MNTHHISPSVIASFLRVTATAWAPVPVLFLREDGTHRGLWRLAACTRSTWRPEPRPT